MTKLEAVTELIREGRRNRMSKASLKRVRKAGKVLGLEPEYEQQSLECFLEFRDRNTYKLYPSFEGV